MEWHQSLILIQHNSSRILELSMTLHNNDSFKSSYSIPMQLNIDDHLFFEVSLHVLGTLAFDFVLEVVSCWATETSNPEGKPKAFFLNDSCAVDDTFRWYTANGLEQISRFSVQIFSINPQKPIHVHCMTKICTQKEKENCSTVNVK
ncbi:UROL1 protein, partial [Amia calva]|nr:UROL1 protein [Amia calva]